MKNKKAKILTISLLGLLLLVPFMKVSIAQGTSQVPSYVGLTEGQHEEWDVYINVLGGEWNQWEADNMSAEWSLAFGHNDNVNMSAVKDMTAKVASPPQFTMFYTVDEIIPDKGGADANMDGGINATEAVDLPGTTLVNMTTTSGSFMDFPGWPYYSYFWEGTAQLISNTTAQFAADLKYGALATSAIWGTNTFNTNNIPPISGPNGTMGDIQTIFFAPNNVNWSEFADECNANLAMELWADAGYGTQNIIKFTNLTNGFTLTSENGSFGIYSQNTVNITLTCTYDTDGLLTYHSFEYGSDKLVEINHVDSVDPVITDASSDFSVPHDYTGITINWTATDINPGEYAILLNGTAEVFPTAWASGVEIQFAVPDGLAPGDHLFTINFADTRPGRPNVASDDVIMTVLPAPVVEPPPDDPTVVIIISSVIGVVVIIAIAVVILRRRK